MNVSTYPPLSQLFKEEVRQAHINNGFDEEIGLQLVDEFLTQHPYYPEALMFKARMLIALGQDKEALAILQAARKIDAWRVAPAFDEAEVYYKLGQKAKAIETVRSAGEVLLREAIEGMQNFLSGIDFIGQERESVFRMIQEEMTRFLSGDSTSLNFDAITPALLNHDIIEEDEAFED